LAVEHVPPGATQKSFGFRLEDATPKRERRSGVSPAFERVTSAMALTEPTWTEPKSTASGLSSGCSISVL